MNWKAPLAVVLTGLALVIGTVVTVANGHDGTPAVTVEGGLLSDSDGPSLAKKSRVASYIGVWLAGWPA